MIAPAGFLKLASVTSTRADSRHGVSGIRRIAPGIELHAGRANRGRIPHVIEDADLLIVVGAGEARLRCRAHDHSLPPALLAVVSIGEVVVLELPAERPYRALHLPPGLIASLSVLTGRAAAASLDSNARVTWVTAGAGLCELADDVVSESDVGGFLQCALSGQRSIERVAVEERPTHAVVHRVREHLRDAYARKVSVDELARMAGMCRFALVRAFTREVGIPPHAYQTHLRVQHARELIGAGWPLSEVSLEVGFTDQSHLNRHFKRVLGTTPGLYARAVANGGTDHRLAAPKNIQERKRKAN